MCGHKVEVYLAYVRDFKGTNMARVEEANRKVVGDKLGR